jgi:imidazolonepropionase-like amidohydrolase
MRVLVGFFLCCMTVGAADAPKPIVLRAARMFDGRSGGMVSPGLVVVTDNLISGVGSAAVIPHDAETIDLGDTTLLPGFMDAHTHLSGAYSDDWKQQTIDGLRKNVAEQALDATENLRKTLMAGFTTVRDVGAPNYMMWA